MPGSYCYRSDQYPDSKSEATYVNARAMPTPWEGEVHELRDRVTNPYPRPKDYGPTDEYLHQLRGEASDYRREPTHKENKVYVTLCCGSKFGALVWAVAVLGFAIAIAILLVKVLVSILDMAC